MDGSIFQAQGTACVKSRNKEGASHIWELREGQHGWSTEREKMNSKKQGWHIKKKFFCHCWFLHLYWYVHRKGAPKTQHLGYGLPAIPKVFPLFFMVIVNHPGQLPWQPLLPLPTEQRGKTEVIQLQVPATT